MLIAFAVIASGCDSPASLAGSGAIRFVQVAEEAGLGRAGATFAAAAADFNRDGWPDLAISEHRAVSLYRNAGGNFVDASEIAAFERSDTHGVSWLDWNRDGWPDLYVSRGACRGDCKRPNVLHLNRGGSRFERADLPKVLGNAKASGRSATPWDMNGDGRLDLMIMNHHRPGRGQKVAVSMPGGYRNLAAQWGWQDKRAVSVSVIQLGGESGFVLVDGGRDAGHIYRRDADGRFVDVTAEIGIELPSRSVVNQVAVGDVDNDGDQDLYLVNAPLRGQGARANSAGIDFYYHQRITGASAGFRFETTGPFVFKYWPRSRRNHAQLRLGGQQKRVADARVVISPSTEAVEGEPDLSSAGPGIYLWRTASGTYELRYLPAQNRPTYAAGQLVSAQGTLRLTGQHGRRYVKAPAPNQLYINEGGHFRAVDTAADPHHGMDAQFVDFDNDGDLDLFVVNGGRLVNQPDRLYENKGDLRFVEVTGSVVVGPERGRGNSVLSFDYDRDGRVDLFVTNGWGPRPRNQQGPYALFRNVSKAGNWLRVKLAPSESNAMALGARVVLQTPNGRQYRWVQAATSAFATSWLPLHFGLGRVEQAQLTVYWPSGRVSVRQVEANQTVTLNERRHKAGNSAVSS